MPATIQAVTFDVGGTLIDPHPSVGHVYAEIAAGFAGSPLDAQLLERRFRSVWKAFPRQLHSAADWAELVDEVFHDLVHPPPSQSFFPRLYARFSEPDVWRVYDDVLPTLRACGGQAFAPRRSRTGMSASGHCSNGCSSPTSSIPSSSPARWGPPSRTQRSSTSPPRPSTCRPESILHVGDDPILDLAASRAGFHAVLIDRDHPDCALPRIHSLTRLVEITRRQRLVS